MVLDIATMKENSHIRSGLKQEEAGAPEQIVYITQSQAGSLEWNYTIEIYQVA